MRNNPFTSCITSNLSHYRQEEMDKKIVTNNASTFLLWKIPLFFMIMALAYLTLFIIKGTTKQN